MADTTPPARNQADASSKSVGLTILAIVAGLILLWIIYMVAFADTGVTGGDGLDTYDNGVQTPVTPDTTPDSIYTPETAPLPGNTLDPGIPPAQTDDMTGTTTQTPAQPPANDDAQPGN